MFHLNLVCKKRLKTKEGLFYVNYTYTITKINTNGIFLSDGDDEIYIENNLIHNHFNYPYCRTSHSWQGCTLEGNIYLFDINHHCASKTWLWVSLTRGTDLDKIYYYN